MKPGDFEDISVSRILHFVQNAGLLNMNIRAAQRIKHGRRAWDTMVPGLLAFYSIRVNSQGKVANM